MNYLFTVVQRAKAGSIVSFKLSKICVRVAMYTFIFCHEDKIFSEYDSRMRPEFFPTPSDFRVVLKNVNYSIVANTAQVTMQDNMLVAFCSLPLILIQHLLSNRNEFEIFLIIILRY